MSMTGLIALDKLKLRDYQLETWLDFVSGKHRRYFLCWHRRCLAGDTHILMHDGSYKLLKHINPGDKILSHNGSQFVVDVVKDVWRTGVKKTVKVSSSGFPDLICSPDHKLATTYVGARGYDWKAASEIHGSTQVMHFAQNNYDGDHNPLLAEFIGCMASDGYVSAYQQPKFTNTSEELLNRVADISMQLFGVTPIWRKKGNGYDIGLSNGTRGGGTFINPVKELFRKYGLDVPKAQRGLHPLLWTLDAPSIKRYFAGVLACDGSLNWSPAREIVFNGVTKLMPESMEISISCGKSKDYAWGTYWLLRKLGVRSAPPKLERDANWKLRIYNSESIRLLLEDNYIYGKADKAEKLLFVSRNYSRDQFLNCWKSTVNVEPCGEQELFDLETEKNGNFVANGYVVHNSGKDLLMWSLMLRAALTRVGFYAYCGPTFSHVKKFVWQNQTIDGIKFLDFIPPELITKTNQSEMSITLYNGSRIQLIGSDSYDKALIGTNCLGIVLSEYQVCKPEVLEYVLPILAANMGWCAIVGTSRSHNHFYTLYNKVKNSPDWYTSLKTVEDTGAVDIAEIEKMVSDGIMSWDMARQEFWCDFSRGSGASYYWKYVDRMRLNDQIGNVNWQSSHPVHTAWDLGIADPGCVIWFQIIGNNIYVIDAYQNKSEDLEHYINIVKSKPYTYGRHLAPHDIEVRDLTAGGLSRREKARQWGINFTVVPRHELYDGIESVKTILPRMYIDEKRCADVIRALENYRKTYHAATDSYIEKPVHDMYSHFCDGIRYLAMGRKKFEIGMTPEDSTRLYEQAQSNNRPRHGRIMGDDPY